MQAPAIGMLDGVTYHYPGAETAALDGLAFALHNGMTGVAGASGSGKSTMLRLFNGLVPNFHGGRLAGRVEVFGHDAPRTPTAVLAREVGFVFQDPEAQFVRGVVEDEVAFALENTGASRELMRARVEEAMAATGIGALAGRSIPSLSGGERQRVAIASAIALRPGLLVLDEPTSQLDPAGSAAVLGACEALARAGTSVLVAEHRVAALLEMVQHLAVLDQGRMYGPGPVPAMLRHLQDPPALLALARALEWDAEVTPGQVRHRPPALKRSFVARSAPRGDVAWRLAGCYVGHQLRPIVQAVDLAGATGEVTVLMGPNGGGKTTLLRTIAGLQPPIAGTAWRRGGRVAYLPQEPGVLLHRQSVRAEVEYTLQRAGRGAPAMEMLRRLDIEVLAARYPGDLSSGQRQRAALAVILAGEPELVLLDEPTRGMDGRARRQLSRLLREMADAGASVVLATHDSELAAEAADRVIGVESGLAEDRGSPAIALSGNQPYATDIGRLYPGGPITVEELLACL